MFVKIIFPDEVFAASVLLLRTVLMTKGWRSDAQLAPGNDRLPGLDLLLAFEAMVSRSKMPMPPALATEVAGSEPVVTLDLTSRASGDGRSLGTCFNGQPGLNGLVSAILEGGSVRADVVGDAQGRSGVWASGLIESTRPLNVTFSMHELVLRLGDLVGQAISRIERGQDPVAPASSSLPCEDGRARPTVATFAMTSLATRIARRLDRIVRHPDHWSVRWRRCGTDAGVGHALDWPDADYRLLPDDGRRYYADPFLFRHGGEDFLFVEELPYATGKGVVSVARVSGETVTPFQTVLEGDVHMSYPQVFEDGGQVWMIPETFGARTVELWRAVEFPGRWEREAVLLDGVDASDATILRHDGLYWLFAALSPLGTSPRDMLGIFVAPSLRGPWRAHPANPVEIDVRTARPGGSFYRRGEDLMRVAQNGSGGYGAGLSLCRVDRLDSETFSQTLVAQLGARPDWGCDGVHTLNALGGIEVIDTVSKVRRGATG